MSTQMIMDLYDRLLKLEKKIEELEKIIASNQASGNAKNSDTSDKPHAKRKYNTMTEEMYIACYECAKRIFDKDDIPPLSEELFELGMNKNSAIIYLNALWAMFDGREFTRSISKESIEFFLERIYDDYGDEGVRTAVESVRKHLVYNFGENAQTTKLWKFCDTYASEF